MGRVADTYRLPTMACGQQKPMALPPASDTVGEPVTVMADEQRWHLRRLLLSVVAVKPAKEMVDE